MTRTTLVEAQHGAAACPSVPAKASLRNEDGCPVDCTLNEWKDDVDCKWVDWTDWAICVEECGDGSQEVQRWKGILPVVRGS